jgi:glycosyl transferase family 25
MGIPTILINLDRSTERLAHVQTEFARVDMTFERFPAVDGTDLPPALKPYFCDASGRIVSPLKPGEIGCYASHLGAWQRIATGDYGPAAMVCEDDVKLPDDLPHILSRLLAALPSAWDLVRLSSRPKRVVVPVAMIDGTYRVVRHSMEPSLAGASLISCEGARKLLAPMIRKRPVDIDFRYPWLFGINAFGVVPTLIQQTDPGSTIQAMGGRLSERPRWVRQHELDVMNRIRYGITTLGLQQWLRCVARNIGYRLRPTLTGERTPPPQRT